MRMLCCLLCCLLLIATACTGTPHGVRCDRHLQRINPPPAAMAIATATDAASAAAARGAP